MTTFPTPTLLSLFSQQPSDFNRRKWGGMLFVVRRTRRFPPHLTTLYFADAANHERWAMFYEGRICSNTTISLMKMHNNKNRQRERTTTSTQQQWQGKHNGSKVGHLLWWLGEGDSCLFLIEGGSILNTTISLMMMHDDERTDNENKRRQANSDEDEEHLSESR